MDAFTPLGLMKTNSPNKLYKEAPKAVPIDNILFIIPFLDESLHTIFVNNIIDKEYPIPKIIKHT